MGSGVNTRITGVTVEVSATVTVRVGVVNGDSANGASGVSVTGGWSKAIIVCVAPASSVAAKAVATTSIVGGASGEVGAKGSIVGVAKGSKVGVAKGSTVGGRAPGASPGVGVATALTLKGCVGVAIKETTTGDGVGVGGGVNEGVGVIVGMKVKVGCGVGWVVSVGVGVVTLICNVAGAETTERPTADAELTVSEPLKLAVARKGPKKGFILSVLAIKSLVKVIF